MRKLSLAALSFFLFPALYAADVRMQVVTPGRVPQGISDIPASIEVVIPEQLRSLPGATIDEKLGALVPGLDTGRDAGDMNDRSAAMSLRGLGIGTQGGRGQGRTLILLDGLPMNDSATGGVNWNELASEELDRVEVLKGPVSSLYGSSALAGAVNIITRRPSAGYSAEASYGTYNTFSSALRAGVRTGAMSIRAFGRALESDGYVHAVEADRDAYTRKSYLRERSAGAKAELDLENAGTVTAGFSRSDGTAGLGTNYRGTAGGEYRNTVTDLVNLSWKGQAAGGDWGVSFFSRCSDQEREEGVSTTRLTDIRVDRDDYGLLASGSAEIGGLFSSFGFDWRHGEVDGYDDYNNGKYARDIGETDSFSPFVQAEKKMIEDRLNLVAGLRYDHVRFHDGFAENTNAPGFFSGDLDERSWSRFTPKVSAGYKYGPNLSQYISLSRGFRAGELENIVLTLVKGSGSSKWYQKPNPSLGPEKAGTAETGFRMNPLPGLYLDPSVYFTGAEDFIYQVETGVTDPTYGTEKMYTNIGRVEIYGLELPAKVISGDFSLSASYAQSHSRIISAPGLGITHNRLTYAPRHMYSAMLAWQSGASGLSVSWTHKSRQFTNDANTDSVPGYSVVSASARKELRRNVSLSVRIGNMFNERRQQSADELAPGRNFTAALKAAF